MALTLYMDHHVPRVITAGLRARGVDVVTAYEDGAHQLEDSTLLERAAELKRVLFTRDEDFLIEATRRQELGIPFYEIVYVHQLRVSVGRCIEDLEIIAMVGEETDLLNEVKYLPRILVYVLCYNKILNMLRIQRY